MATDIQQIVAHLCEFYDFRGKTVIDVGAGGGQLVDFARAAKKVIAVDSDAAALQLLERALADKGLAGLFELRLGDFHALAAAGDVVLFEFCLHEMPDPLAAIAHARTLAADVVVIDHAPGSEWTYYGAEDDKVQSSFEGLQRAGVRAQSICHGEQRFSDHAELLAKIAPQGDVAIARCARFREALDIVIPMVYGVTLL